MAVEDQMILQLYWSRNESAISATDEKYGRWCYGIANRILQLHEESEECVSDTYFRAWNRIPPERPDIFRAWLGKITRNLALDRYRHLHAEKRGGGEVDILLSELGDVVSGRSDLDLDSAVVRDALNAFLKSLKEEQRNIFMRRYWHGESVQSIAKKYGMSESKVTSTLFRLRKKLKASLEKEGISL